MAMYTEILGHLEEYLKKNITAAGGDIGTGYLAEFPTIDLRVPYVLMEPKLDDRKPNSTRWNSGTFRVVLWVIVGYGMDYKTSMNTLEELLSSTDDEWLSMEGDGLLMPSLPNGLHSCLTKLKRENAFLTLGGSSGGKAWRVNDKGLNFTRTQFSIVQRASEKVNVAQVTVEIYLDAER